MRAKSEKWRIAMLVLGWLLIALAAPVGLLPGPGGIFVLAAGMILLLRNSAWVRRRYAELKRKWPRAGDVCDQAMRRPSAKRRRALAKARLANAPSGPIDADRTFP